MDTQEIYDKLTDLTEGLLYISETESEFSVYEVEEDTDVNDVMEDVAEVSVTTFHEENYTLFFDKVLTALNVDDAVMQEIKQRYTLLFGFIQSNFTSIKVLVAGDTEQNIFINCTTVDEHTFLLHTTAIES